MSTPYEDRKMIAPVAYPDNQPFWEAANRGELLVKWCRACETPHWYPRPVCPCCGSHATEFRPSAGKGTIYSLSVTRKAGPVAYAMAYVTLAEGVTMMTNIVDCDLDSLRIGDRVEVIFKATDSGQRVPTFRPMPGEDTR